MKERNRLLGLRLPGLPVAVLVALAFAGHAQAAWYSPAWNFRKLITLNGGLVPAAQANFPVLLSFTDAHLGALAQATGNDILFTLNDGTTKLNHEIESYTFRPEPWSPGSTSPRSPAPPTPRSTCTTATRPPGTSRT